jgi:hypothetical protein
MFIMAFEARPHEDTDATNSNPDPVLAAMLVTARLQPHELDHGHIHIASLILQDAGMDYPSLPDRQAATD